MADHKKEISEATLRAKKKSSAEDKEAKLKKEGITAEKKETGKEEKKEIKDEKKDPLAERKLEEAKKEDLEEELRLLLEKGSKLEETITAEAPLQMEKRLEQEIQIAYQNKVNETIPAYMPGNTKTDGMYQNAIGGNDGIPYQKPPEDFERKTGINLIEDELEKRKKRNYTR